METIEKVLQPSLAFDEMPFQSQALLPSFSGPLLFAEPRIPTGIVVDSQGNVIIQSDDQFGAITKLSPTGQIINQVPTASGILTLERRFAIDSQTGSILGLANQGQLSIFDSNTLQEQPLGSLKSLAVDTSRVYDVATGTVGNAGALIIPQQANYGDFAIVSGNGFTDLYVSGISVAFPFVMRVRFAQNTVSSEVLVMSSASGAPNDNSPPGIAVSPQGLVLTTLTTGSTAGTFSVPIAFSTDFSGGVGTLTPTIVGNGQLFVSSRGMTADAAGNFYIATSSIGVSGGGVSAAGALLVLDAELNNFVVLGQDSPASLNGLVDVAVNAEGTRIYATQDIFTIGPGSDRVIAFVASPTAASLNADATDALLSGGADTSLRLAGDDARLPVTSNGLSQEPAIAPLLSDAMVLGAGVADALTTPFEVTDPGLLLGSPEGRDGLLQEMVLSSP